MGKVALRPESTVPQLVEAAQFSLVESAVCAKLVCIVGKAAVLIATHARVYQPFAHLCASKIWWRLQLIGGVSKHAASAFHTHSKQVELAHFRLLKLLQAWLLIPLGRRCSQCERHCAWADEK